ncbi:MAG: hypothetical protein CMH98_13500 [Oceanospirillaceae bacterium]|nr:hypothetical protein [Oceanospirillaceae bacterium]
MSEPFLGEIRMFPYNFAPRYWAYCDGQILPINQNDVLYAIIGDMYGGDGQSTIGLPNLQGRVPMHPGQAPGLSNYTVSMYGGVPKVQVFKQHMPSHRHTLKGTFNMGETADSSNTVYPATDPEPSTSGYHVADTNLDGMAAHALDTAYGASDGSIVAHENRQPYITVPFCIAMEGVFPPRN